MTATLETGTIKQSVLVRCVGRSIAVQDVEDLEADLSRKVNQGWLISDRQVSDNVRRSLERTDVLAFRLSEFLEQRVWGPYFDSLKSLVEKDRIPQLYVDIGCYRQQSCEADDTTKRENYKSLDAAIDEWLAARDKMHVSLLGEFGSGKTWFCRHYAYRQLTRYLDNPAKERLPLLITLRNFTKASTAKELITNAIVDQYQLSFLGDPFDIFDELNRRGKILLILDGFDEMARKVDKQTMVDNFWELAKLVHDNSKVILTSRTEYFRWAKEAESVLGGEELGRQIPALQPPKFDVLYLEPFTDPQIRSVIMGRLGDDGAEAAEKLLCNENLKEMARKPVLIELLLAAAEEAKADLLTDQAAVYLYATNKLLLRNITEHRTFTSTSDKLLFLCELAWQMISSGELRIHYKDIPGRIRQHFAAKIKAGSDLDHWDYDLRNQTLLRPDLQGFYEFSHKSLAEFFVAFKFVAELGWLSSPFTNTYVEDGGKLCELPFGKLDNQQLANTLGARNIGSAEMLAVRAFMSQMVGEKDEPLARVRSLAGEHDLHHTTANIVTILSDCGYLVHAAALRNLDMRGAVIRTSQLREKDASGSLYAGTTIYIDDSSTFDDGCIGRGVITGLPVIAGLASGDWRVERTKFFSLHTLIWPSYLTNDAEDTANAIVSRLLSERFESLRSASVSTLMKGHIRNAPTQVEVFDVVRHGIIESSMEEADHVVIDTEYQTPRLERWRIETSVKSWVIKKDRSARTNKTVIHRIELKWFTECISDRRVDLTEIYCLAHRRDVHDS